METLPVLFIIVSSNMQTSEAAASIFILYMWANEAESVQKWKKKKKAVIRGQIHHVPLSSSYLARNSSHFSTWQQRNKNWCLFELWGEHCFKPLIKPVGKWHDNLWGHTHWDPVSAGGNTDTGKKVNKKREIKRGRKRRGRRSEVDNQHAPEWDIPSLN